MRLPDLIQKELDALGDRARLEMGSRHLHVLVDGRLAAILPKDGAGNDSSRNGAMNIRAQIRRAARCAA